MYVSMKEMLQHASVNNYAVPAPNCPSYALVKAACMAAAEKKSAVILDVSPRQMRMNATPEVWAPMVKAIAEPLNVPVALNLDHGGEFEENIRRVQQVVTFAHAHGVSVEAELGHVGQAAEGDGRSDDMYTKVDMAVEFVERTGCDMLAVAIGTAHGKYPADYVPTLDFDRLAEIKKALGEKYPLVLHGGSGAGDENFKKAVAGGINKVNLWTDYGRTYVNAMRDFLAENESPDYIFVTTDAEEKAAKWLERYMDLFGSSNRYQFSDDKMVETD